MFRAQKLSPVVSLLLSSLIAPAAWAQEAPVPAVAASAPPAGAGAPTAPTQPTAGASIAPSSSAQGFEVGEPPERMLPELELVSEDAGGLTADEVARRAVLTSPTLEVRRAEIDAAKAQVNEVINQFLPRLMLSATYTRLSSAEQNLGGFMVGAENEGVLAVGPVTDPDSGATTDLVVDSAGSPVGAAAFEIPNVLNNYDLTAELLIPLSDYILRLPGAKNAANKMVESKEYGKEASARQAALDARIAYHQWLLAQASVSIAEGSLERTKALQGDAKASFALGASTKADTLRIDALAARTEVALAQTKQMRRLSQEQLTVIMDDDGQTPYAIGEAPRLGARVNDPRAVESDAMLDRLVKEGIDRRPELKALDAAEASLKDAKRTTNMGRLPRLDGFGQATYANPNQRYMFNGAEWNGSWAAGLRLSYSLTDTLVGGSQAAQLEAQAAQVRGQRREAERGIRLQVTDAQLELVRASSAVDSAERGYEAAEEAYRVARALYQVGQATTTDLINAESELLSSMLQRVSAAVDQRLALLRLDYAVGEDIVPHEARATK